ncbi:MAG: hypothetical protein CMO80_11985 [Verrucomicrobiales bacterium]|nr:hypothetical protein [Verrucomicrobiales bacterium]|tara:strand:+ start:7019 stop:7855 length:837 start_codon:yes stop_codon:yes gene_type:complete
MNANRIPARPQAPLNLPRTYQEPPVELPKQEVKVHKSQRPINLDCALAKLLQSLENFSAVGTVEIHREVDGRPDVRSLPLTISILGGQIRSEIDLRRVEEGLKLDDQFATMRQIGVNQLVTITLPKVSTYSVLVPAARSYISHNLPLADVPGLIRVASRVAGQETIHGKVYSKFDLEMLYNTDDRVKVEWWAKPENKDQPEFLKFIREGSSIVVRFKTYQMAPPPAASYEVPNDYRKYADMDLLMQAITVAQTPLGKVKPINTEQTFRARFNNDRRGQ